MANLAPLLDPALFSRREAKTKEEGFAIFSEDGPGQASYQNNENILCSKTCGTDNVKQRGQQDPTPKRIYEAEIHWKGTTGLIMNISKDPTPKKFMSGEMRH